MNDDTANLIDNLMRAAAQVRLAAIENRLTKITGDLRRALKAGYKLRRVAGGAAIVILTTLTKSSPQPNVSA